MQPAFFYSAVLLSIALASALLLIRINGAMGSRWRSLMYVLPLTLPLAIICLFPPSAYIPMPGMGSGPAVSSAPLFDGITGLSPIDTGLLPPLPPAAQMLSVPGLMIVIGLTLGVLSLSFSYLLGEHMTRKLLGVIDLVPEDCPSLQADVALLASKIGVPTPRVGLVEDLRPNAFTFGQGKRATVVFSLGLLDLLDGSELRAVIAHELAHIKNGDVRFKALTRALAWVSFFNPASHLSVRAARREREKLADETARTVLEDKESLVRAIGKVTAFLDGNVGRPSLASRLGLGHALSITEKTSLMSTHPSFSDRVRSFRNDNDVIAFTPAVCIALSAAVILATSLLFLSIGEVRAEIIHYSLGGGFGPVPSLHHPVGQPFMALQAVHPYHVMNEHSFFYCSTSP